MNELQNAFKTYILFHALKRHFTTDNYDYFKYNGKIRANFDTFEKRKDRWFYYKLSKKSNPQNFVVSNMIHKPDIWVGDLVSDSTYDEIYNEWEKRNQALLYHYKKDLKKLNEDFDFNFKVIDGQHPLLLKKIASKEISLETAIILNNLVDYLPKWRKKIVDTIVFPDINKVMVKYRPFLNYEVIKFRNATLKHFST